MVDISNKALALVLVASIFVSLGGTLVSLNSLGEAGGLTGYATTDSGQANITIEGDISIQFTTAEINLGSGYTNDTDGGATIEYCTFDTNGTNASAGTHCVFDTADGLSPFNISNIGNQDVSLALEWDRNAASLLGGTSPVFNYSVEDATGTSCSAGLTPTAWTAIANGTVCTNFNYEGGQDTLLVHVAVSVPQDATTGSRTATVTATAT